MNATLLGHRRVNIKRRLFSFPTLQKIFIEIFAAPKWEMMSVESLFKFAPCLVVILKVIFVSKLIQLQCCEPAVSETKVVKLFYYAFLLNEKLIDENLSLFWQILKVSLTVFRSLNFHMSRIYEFLPRPKAHNYKKIRLFVKRNQQYLFSTLKRGK